jgi:hypothetical protein
LFRDRTAELCDNAGGHAQFESNSVNVPAARSTAGDQKHPVLFLIGDYFLDKTRQSFNPAVTDGLAADFQDIDIRKESLLGSNLKAFN